MAEKGAADLHSLNGSNGATNEGGRTFGVHVAVRAQKSTSTWLQIRWTDNELQNTKK